ncbi:hypothetical protein [Sandaracinus amylolyticus]|uniref:hypothetical protein n=1 Tax=Sandaracinus amylolyticus TaxID=927083 RepID=UPI0012ECC9E1|nr:hypothetical protein [Sandaracinus amylolyticus]
MTNRVVEMLEASRDALVATATRAVDREPLQGAPSYSRDDLAQMVDGFLHVLRERADARSDDAYEFYIDTVIPGLVAQGSSPESIVHGTVAWCARVMVLATRGLPHPDDTVELDWLAAFFAGYVRDIANSAFRAARK